MPTITLPDDIAAGGAALVKTFSTTDNVVYSGLPPGVVAGVDITAPTPITDFGSASAGACAGGVNKQGAEWGFIYGGGKFFLYKDGVRITSFATWKCRRNNPDSFTTDWLTLYPVADGPGLYRHFALVADNYAYDIEIVLPVTIMPGSYVFYAVRPQYGFSNEVGTLSGYVFRRFAFDVVLAGGGGGGVIVDPAPDNCPCEWHRPVAVTNVWKRPSCH